MSSWFALLIANLWFVSAVKSSEWKYAIGIIWLFVALMGVRI